MNVIPLFQGGETPDQTLSIHIELAVCLVIADGHFNLLQGFLRVCMG